MFGKPHEPLVRPLEIGMKITKVEPMVLEAPVKEPWRIGTAVYHSMHAMLVRIDTDAGITGFGEGLVRYSPRAGTVVVQEILTPVLLGQDPFNVELTWDRMYAVMRGRGHSKGFMLEAMSAVDIALWDILGKALGQPVHRLLGSYGRSALPVYASSLLFKPTAELVREAEGLAAQGFPGMKLKIGQWAAALPNLLTFEHMYPPNPLREELLADPLPSPKNGRIEVPERPGLGIEVSQQALARFRTA
jgi:L-alanine-DL-glutamate epimerase-like enolase superfamily enzyme